VFPNYLWRIAGHDNDDGTPNVSRLTLQYALTWNLPNAWQIGINNTASYDHQASSGNEWNVPLGPFVSKTTRFGSMPVKLQLSAEYSIVHQDDFGQRAQVKLSMIPVIPGLVQTPVFGGS